MTTEVKKSFGILTKHKSLILICSFIKIIWLIVFSSYNNI